MKLFTVGPVEMYPSTLEVSGKQLPYFRTSDFSKIMLDSENILKKLVNASKKSKVIFLTASGTGAMEASVMNLLSADDKALIVNGGSFGKRFCQICDVHKIQYDSIDLKYGEELSEQMMVNKGYTSFLVNIDETSTGQLYDLKMISDFCIRHNLLLIVDAISSFLADPLDMEKYKIDALILSSQKALALSPGISLVLLSERAYDLLDVRQSGSLYFDFKAYIEDMERGQTPFTPAVGILLELNEMLHEIEGMGIDEKINGIAHLAHYFRKNAVQCGLTIPDYKLSNAVTPIFFENGGAYELFERLKDEYDIFVTPSGGEFKDKVIRVSHLGNLCEKDYDALLSCIQKIQLNKD